ncbi:MAG: cyclopropane-fatty-acyl-phospholipid synthase family protein [Rickettsiales bacterium]|nr:cyclopropane-fatty-acyl-phospholipid synthase family protein [Rickettsiales bacterium]
MENTQQNIGSTKAKGLFPASLLFKSLIKKGALDIIDATGQRHRFNGTPGQQVTLRLNEKVNPWKLFLNPQIELPEAYMFGNLTIEEGTLDEFLLLLAQNNQDMRDFFFSHLQTKLRWGLRKVFQDNSPAKARANVQNHYDISNDLYKLFLDKDMQYSCAYFSHPEESLEQAQINKKNHIIAKLDLHPGQRVLDIGCGWGGLGIEMARQKGVHVTGVTLSEKQHQLATQRVKDAGLEGQVDFKLLDYRKLEGKFDRIVSVGMFEHVGVPHYPEYFAKVNELLADDGRMLLHSIGYKKPSLATQPWLEKYIFCGGYLPALSETIPFIEEAGFWVTDVEVLRLHYSYTLREWKKRFREHEAQVKQMYDDTFFRMFDLYLAGCELAMIYSGTMAFQVQFAKQITAVPITRDYMYAQDEGRQRMAQTG